MGITIHIEGTLKSQKDYNEFIAFSTAFAEENSLQYELFKDRKNFLIKVKNGKIIDEEYMVKGIKIKPDENSESLHFEFDDDLHTQTFCKTQFACAETHIFIISFLRKIEPFFENLKVIDEGGYWESNDRSALEEKMQFLTKMIDEISEKYKEQKDQKWRYN